MIEQLDNLLVIFSSFGVNRKHPFHVASPLPLVLRSACNFSHTCNSISIYSPPTFSDVIYTDLFLGIELIVGSALIAFHKYSVTGFTSVRNDERFNYRMILTRNKNAIFKINRKPRFDYHYFDVHSTIPFDSTPLILAGFKLHKTATFRFCISSNGTNLARPLTT